MHPPHLCKVFIMQFREIGVVGTGLVGLGWAVVFARTGLNVRMYDCEAPVLAAAHGRLSKMLEEMEQHELIEDPTVVLGRIAVAKSLGEAVGDADYVQESVFERVDVKHGISRDIGTLIRNDAVVGSSSSGIPASAFTADIPNRERFLIAHPVNPPHLIPLVELVPSPWTDPAIAPALRVWFKATGQSPIVVNREIEGFVLNRLQGALLNEAWALYDEGIASIDDIDRCVSDGLGLRWSFMGPFETIDLNAPGGIVDYAARLGPLYHALANSRHAPQSWSPELIARVTAERRASQPEGALLERMNWRDRELMTLARHRLAR
jgi:3-hydroxyacyl-CoA dehydrogenase